MCVRGWGGGREEEWERDSCMSSCIRQHDCGVGRMREAWVGELSILCLASSCHGVEEWIRSDEGEGRGGEQTPLNLNTRTFILMYGT